ncbi:hypothetical protein [Gluconobacter cerinus]|uniref:hypothetical protein n=1 Tax=Gluconobacter cerinus TaxID=38307 RepID=UPI001B8B3693|nr:hypothetical protein [Gluconobacter cerinus]MBS1038113.1 hypothetical protein [Gluconobacter cerinus]
MNSNENDHLAFIGLTIIALACLPIGYILNLHKMLTVDAYNSFMIVGGIGLLLFGIFVVLVLLSMMKGTTKENKKQEFNNEDINP